MGWEIFKRVSTNTAAEGNEEKSPTDKVLEYLEGELEVLRSLKDSESEEMQLKYHQECINLLGKESNGNTGLNKLLSDIETDLECDSLKKSDVLKTFNELCLILKNAAEQDEKMEETERTTLAAEYDKLFQRAETLKHDMEYQEAKKMGFEGSLEEFVSHLVAQ